MLFAFLKSVLVLFEIQGALSQFVVEGESNVDGVLLFINSRLIEVLVHAYTPVLVNFVGGREVEVHLVGEGSSNSSFGCIREFDIDTVVHPNGLAMNSFLRLNLSFFALGRMAVKELSRCGVLVLSICASDREDRLSLVVFVVLPVSTDPAEDVFRALVGGVHLGHSHALIFTVDIVSDFGTSVPLVTRNVSAGVHLLITVDFVFEEETSAIFLTHSCAETLSEGTSKLVFLEVVATCKVNIELVSTFVVDLSFK